ncbi:response regulator [Haloterrigena alkaliphila]|uniref:response regulator n=1 Tax=Haloterrigena alkaliphila TaxID=2816475 RepID=UPI001D00136C|nr:response regulator [Haloterrigena alkaliphila]UHQ95145.1 response regulator [Haloterrigena alkaliphila]
MINRPPIEVLVIDPNGEDVQLFLETLEDVTSANAVSTASSGAEALEIVRQRTSDPDRSRPNLVVLDIDLPKMDWRTLLETFDADPEWTGVPVVVFTAVDQRKSIAQSYANHANAYVRKPADRDGFVDVVRTLGEFWFDVVWLPPRDERNGERH